MGYNINGTQMVVESNTFKIKNASNDLHMSFDTAGITKRSSQHPMFYACENAAPAWISLGPTATWTIFNGWGNVIVNNYSCFSSSTFTAPQTGAYLFGMSQYISHPNASTDYCHPMFAVNGSYSARHYNSNTHYRVSLYGHTIGYSADSDINEIYYLTAGDYVNTINYVSGTVNYYSTYGYFAGWFLG